MTSGGEGEGTTGESTPLQTDQGRESQQPRVPAFGKPWTPILLTRWSGGYLSEKGVEGGRLDAELILAHVLGVGRLDLYLQHDRPLSPLELASFKELLKRRAAREPLQYVLGTVSFRELTLRSDPRALIPRPETEVLVQEILNWAREAEPRFATQASKGPDEAAGAKPLSALDIGVGTGAISLSLLAEGPFGWVVGTDVSSQALAIARENAEALGFLETLDLREGPLFEAVEPGERFHVVASNPPYVPEADLHQLEPEVRDWEPSDALLAGPEGLDVLIPLIQGVPDTLVPGGLLALEVGFGQASRVVQAVEETRAFREVRIRPDLSGRERVVLGVA